MTKKDKKFDKDSKKTSSGTSSGLGGCDETGKTKEGTKKQTTSTSEDKVKELTDDLQRLQADFENYKKRSEKENSRFKEYSNAELVKKILPVIDSFELALKNTDKDKHEDFVSGVELIFSQLFAALEEEGLRKIESVGKKVDSNYHDVMLSAPSDEEDDVVLEDLQCGYMLKNAVLRHSKVKISKN